MSARADAVDALIAEYTACSTRLDALVAHLDPVAGSTRPPGGGWSIVECVDHLRLTAEAFLPTLADRLASANTDEGAPERPFRRDVVGWLLCVMLEPPVRFRSSTAATFSPQPSANPREAAAHLDRAHDALVALLRESAARGVPLDRVRVASPFDARVKYSAWSAFRVIVVHARRHLWQAEQVRATLSA